MKLPFQIDSLDSIEEPQRGLYQQTEDGKSYALDLDAYDEWVKSPVVKKNKELLGKLNNFKGYEKLAKFKDVDEEEFDAYQAWKKAKDENGDDDPNADPNKAANVAELQQKWREDRERELKKQAEKHKAEIAEKDRLLSETETKRRSFVKRTLLTSIALEKDVLPDRLRTWLKEAEDYFTLNDRDELVALDDEGDVSDVKPETYVGGALREKFGFLYAAPTQGGGGSQGSKGATHRDVDWHKLSPAERIAYGRKQQQQKARV